MDAQLLFAIQSHLGCPFNDALFQVLTALGNGGLVWFAITLCLLIRRDTRYIGLMMGISIILSAGIVQFGIKPLFSRLRPYQIYNYPILINPPFGTSFPSGHTATSFAAAWCYVTLRRNAIRWLLLLLAAGIAFSRMYLFVHYPSDVLVGAIIGIIVPYITRLIVDKAYAKFSLERWIPPLS